MGFMDYRYLSERQMKGFDHYQYSSIDTSPVSNYISHPFWNQVVKIYPKWLAPNVLTFSGMVLVMSGFGILSVYDYQFYASSDSVPQFPPIPSWIWLLCAFCTFFAHVLDGTDGKQARRTGSSGPTGELFDHGIDSWLTLPFTLSLFSMFGRVEYSVSAFRQLLILMSVQFVFIVSHWEKYNTGILFLSWGYDISQYSLALFYLITYMVGGHGFWKFYLVPWFQISPANVAEFLFYFACFGMSVPMSLWNINKCYAAGSLKQSSWGEAFLPMASTVALFGSAIVWAVHSPSGIIDNDPRAFSWLTGTIFSNIACRLIVSQMTQTRCDPLNWMLGPFVGFGGLCCLGLIPRGLELFLLRVLAIFVTFAHIHYGVCVVRQMCNHFGICCFSLQKPVQSPSRVSEEKLHSQ